MAVTGFDFKIESNGELSIDSDSHDIERVSDFALKLQLAYSRIISCTNDWFYDEVGANLEELVGRRITDTLVSVGNQRITEVLTYDGLFDDDDIYVQSLIKNNTQLIYTVYFKLYTNDEYAETSTTITVSLDLIKGVKVKYGWDNDNLYILS